VLNKAGQRNKMRIYEERGSEMNKEKREFSNKSGKQDEEENSGA
jgi:hypothetical protein